MPNQTPIIALSLTSLLALAGCAGHNIDRTVPIRDSSGVASLTPSPALDIQNFRGVVHVRVVKGLDTPVVRATAIGSASRGASPDWVAAELIADQGRSVLRVLAIPTSGQSSPVHIEVDLPGCAGVRVRNAGGDVVLAGVGGAVQVENGGPDSPGGPITLTTDQSLTDHLALETTSGNITLSMGMYSAGTMTIEAPSGVTFNAPRSGAANVQTQGWNWSGVINHGASPMTIKTGAGKATVSIGH